ncbi:MAG: hypothetical protein PVF77_02645 [Anaerolineae bacterium]|jgi:hypothetical protein
MHQSSQNRIILVGAIVAILALLVGAGLGLLLSRGIKPPLQSNKAFTSLEVSTKEDYIILVAATYSRDHDLEKAQAQLARLEAPNINLWIASLLDRALAGEWGEANTRALMELAHGLGMDSPQVLAYMTTLTPPPTSTPAPTDTPAPSDTPTPVPTLPASDTPTAVPPTATPQPTSTPLPSPSDTPIPPTPTAAPTDTPRPQPTNTSRPQPTNTARPTNTPAAKWSWTARLVSPGEDGQQCPDATGLKLIRVTVLDAAGSQIPGVWVHERYTGLYQVSGHKGDDPFWGEGEVELAGLDGGQVCIAPGEGGACESDFTRDLPCHDPPPFEDMWAAGYCECCTPGISKEDCKALYDAGQCLGISHYSWRVEFKRSW